MVSAKQGATDGLGAIPLPFPPEALEPHISARTVDTHYHRHHKAYADRLAGFVRANPEHKRESLEELIVSTRDGITIEESINAMATLVWNHNFYWQSLKPGGGIPAKPSGPLAEAVRSAFGSVEGLQEEITGSALGLGIGWVWLLWTPRGLRVDRTDYHTSPIARGEKPLLTLDVWEHAYYLDYRHDRAEYVHNVLDHLLNWEFAQANLERAAGKKKMVGG
jgi:Fe-Mn family superoxide dismutase